MLLVITIAMCITAVICFNKTNSIKQLSDLFMYSCLKQIVTEWLIYKPKSVTISTTQLSGLQWPICHQILELLLVLHHYSTWLSFPSHNSVVTCYTWLCVGNGREGGEWSEMAILQSPRSLFWYVSHNSITVNLGFTDAQ